jgi:hypothetical protein
MRTKTEKFDVLENDNVFITEWINNLPLFSKGFVFVWTSWKVLKQWIEFDDEQRRLRNEIKVLNERKKENSELILKFMRDNSVDDFHLEGNGLGVLSRSTRTTRPPLKRNVIKTQLLLQFSDLRAHHRHALLRRAFSSPLALPHPTVTSVLQP